MSFWLKFKSLFRKNRFEAEMAEEMKLHLEMQAEQNKARGLNAEEAYFAAQREFGNLASIQERAREERFGVWFEQFFQDVVYAVRQLRRAPGFAVVVVLTLAMGIGINSAVFSVIDKLLMEPLPIPDASGVWNVAFSTSDQNFFSGQVYWPLYEYYSKENKSFSSLCGFATIWTETRAIGAKKQFFYGELVTGNYFTSLGLKPVIGRTIDDSDNRAPGCSPVAVISYAFWQSHYGGAADVLGSQMLVANTNLTIVGVAPAGWNGLNISRGPNFSYWAPAAMEKAIGARTLYQMAGRLRPTATVELAQEELDAITAGIVERIKNKPPAGYERYGLTFPENARVKLVRAALGRIVSEFGGRDEAARLALLFAGASSLVLIIGSANVANLMLARALRRQREMTVRLVLGAGGGRIIRQLLTECLLLATVGAGIGTLLAHWGLEMLVARRTGMLKYIPLEDLSLNGRVLGFTIILAVLTGLLFGLAPIWQVFRLELTSGLKVDATSVTSLRRGRVTLRNLLVVVQVTACFVLLLGACLCIRSFSKLSAVDPGFDKRNVMAASLAISHEKYSEEQSWVFMDQLLAHVQAMPGIKDQAVADMIIPFGGMAVATMATELEGYVVRPDERLVYSVNSIGPGVFRVLGIPVLLGRDFDQHDRGKNSTRVAIVNESFVRRYWPKSNPIGKHIDGAEVIGVVRDSQWKNLSEVADPRVFMAIFQGVKVTEMEARTITLWLKTDRDPMETASWLQSELRKLDPTSVELVQLESLERLHVAALAGQRSLMQLLVGLACGALVIAIIGLYGVLAYSVEQRTKEIGVRIAIGARPEYVLWLIIRQGMSLVGIGLVTGCIVSIAVTRGLGSWLYGISAHDKENYLGAAALLSVIAFIACWLPARRAARIDPAITLRSE